MLPERFRARLPAVMVVALLLAMFLQGYLSMIRLSATFDETAHLPSGYAYLKTGDFRLNPQHPPLVKLLAALPLLPLDPRLDLEHPTWEVADQWGFGERFLYGNDADRLLLRGRLVVLLLGLLLAFIVYLWARDLFGPAAGVVALFLCAFSPTVLAHARLVTFDVPLACFFTAGAYCLWRYLRGGRTRDLILAGSGLGLAMATKFSGVILLAAFLVLIVWAALAPRSGAWPDLADRRSRLSRAGMAAVTVAAIAAVVVQATYLFSSDLLLYWKGLARVYADHNPDHAYFLAGEFRPGGFWYYFPLAFLFKTPVPTILLLSAAVLWMRRFRAERPIDELCLVLPALLFAAVTCAMAKNLGIRYLLPVYPLLFVFVGRLALALPGRMPLRVAAVVLASWTVAGGLLIYPDHLAYFNVACGGPANGHRLLDDSNIDWGGNLKRLRAYMDRRGIDRIRLGFRPTRAIDYYGINARPVANEEWARQPPPGVYVFSTHLLIRGELYAREHGLATDWLSRYEPAGRVGYALYIFEFP